MNKSLMYLLVGVGGAVGSYLPVIIFKVDGFSAISILGGVVGGIAGIYLAYKLSVG